MRNNVRASCRAIIISWFAKVFSRFYVRKIAQAAGNRDTHRIGYSRIVGQVRRVSISLGFSRLDMRPDTVHLSAVARRLPRFIEGYFYYRRSIKLAPADKKLGETVMP